MKIMEFELEMDRWGYIVQGGCEGSTENAVIKTLAGDYKEARANKSNIPSFF